MYSEATISDRKLFTLFIIFTFGLTWGIGLLAFLFPQTLASIFGEFGYKNPLYIIAVYGPAFSALFLIIRYYKIRGLKLFLRRLLIFKMPLANWLFITLGIPLIYYLSASIEGTVAEGIPPSQWLGVLPAIIFMLLLGPVEEFGWRGVGLPLLQRRFSPIVSGILIGLIWGVWHLPAFFIGGTPHYEWMFLSFFLGVISLSVIMTAFFNDSEGSIIIAALFHFQINNPIWPDAHIWSPIVFLFTALIIFLLKRKEMLSRDTGITSLFFNV